jgi:hypothetical protein
MKSRYFLYIALLIPALTLLAVESSSAANQGGIHRSPSATGATVSFANIADGDIVPPEFSVRFLVSGMSIAPAGSDIDNTGHHHLLIDVDDMPALDLPLPATDNIRHFGKGQSEVTLQLPEGKHSLQLLLADYRHIPHRPPVMSDVIVVVVSSDAPPQDPDKKDP